MVVLYHEEYRPPFLPFLAVIPPLLPIFWLYSVDITNDTLSFGYSWNMARKSAPISQVKSASPVTDIKGLGDWGGWGIRCNLSGEIGYIAKNGNGVRVILENEKCYVFNCDEPEKACKILNELM
jgi:hypothetical protein